MRVLIVHNRYQQAGGEDSVVRDEAGMLRMNGVFVQVYERHNDEIASIPRLQLLRDTVWSRRTLADLASHIKSVRPDVIHAHNTFPLVSPSLYYAAARAGVPLVQTLHNFRLFCAQAMFLRDGRVCEDCIGTLPWRGVIHRCYRQSSAQTAVVVGMLGIHRALGTYRNYVTRYIAFNEFCRNKFVQAGLPPDKIVIKPNFVDIPPPDPAMERGGALFVGRLSQEKGTALLAEVARQRASAPIEVVGDGPERGRLTGLPGIRLVGWQEPLQVRARMHKSAYVLMPSIWYENFGLVILEAFACATPVIASRLGAMPELVKKDGSTGLLFEPGDVADLARKMAWADAHPAEMRRMGEAARREYEDKYTPATNYAQLMAIYRNAMGSVRTKQA